MAAAELRSTAWAGVAAQQRLFGEHLAGASVVAGVGWTGSLVPSAPEPALLNVAVPDQPEIVPDLDELRATFAPHDVRWGVWVDPESAGTARFASLGMETVNACVVMAIELGDRPGTPGTPDAKGVRQTEDLRFVAALNDRAYGLMDRRLERHFGVLPSSAVHAHRIGDDAVVAAVDHRDDASLFFVATAPGRRRRGFGTAIVAGALAAAAQRRRRTATLLATPDGVRIYERLGFRVLGHAALWATRRRT